MGRRSRGVLRLCRVLLLLGLVAAVLGIGSPLLGGPSATAADSRPADSRPAAAALLSGPVPELPGAAASLHARGPAGYHGTTVPGPTASAVPTPARATPSPTRAPAVTPSAAARTSAAHVAPTAAPAATGASLPLPVNTGSSTQIVTVVASSSSSTTAELTAWEKGPGGWTAVLGPVTAHVGAQGIGHASETTSRTPAGTFTLTEAFGRAADPGTRLPYRRINADDYWVSDASSPLYNQFTECVVSACPFDTAAGEHLWDAGSSYTYAAVIDYNRWPAVPGAGSAFFLHVTNGAATAGCVAIDQASLVTVLRWLDPSARPLIAIGVG